MVIIPLPFQLPLHSILKSGFQAFSFAEKKPSESVGSVEKIKSQAQFFSCLAFSLPCIPFLIMEQFATY